MMTSLNRSLFRLGVPTSAVVTSRHMAKLYQRRDLIAQRGVVIWRRKPLNMPEPSSNSIGSTEIKHLFTSGLTCLRAFNSNLISRHDLESLLQ
jgi:hypothetical protein